MRKLFSLVALAVVALGAQAQSYPGSKPISIVVPFTAGGPTDRVARDLAEAMRKQIPGSNFVVENAAGAGGTIGATKVAKAAPDGHSLLLFHIGMAATPALYRKIAYKPLEDFEFLGMVNDVPMTLIARKDIPANNLQELIALLKKDPGKLSYGSDGNGTASHLGMEILKYKGNFQLTHIPYRGSTPMITRFAR